MSTIHTAKEIAVRLETTKAFRSAGLVTTAVAAMFISALPGLGPIAVAADKLGGKLFQPDLEGDFTKLCRLVSDLGPEIEKIATIEERLQAVAAVVNENAALRVQVEELAKRIAPAVQSEFGVFTDAGQQTFADIVIKNMTVSVEATAGGVNRLHNVKSSGGNVYFRSSAGGRQEVSHSSFTGLAGGVGMDGLGIQGPISAPVNEVSGVSFGPGGSISFGPGSSLTFGAPPKSKK